MLGNGAGIANGGVMHTSGIAIDIPAPQVATALTCSPPARRWRRATPLRIRTRGGPEGGSGVFRRTTFAMSMAIPTGIATIPTAMSTKGSTALTPLKIRAAFWATDFAGVFWLGLPMRGSTTTPALRT